MHGLVRILRCFRVLTVFFFFLRHDGVGGDDIVTPQSTFLMFGISIIQNSIFYPSSNCFSSTPPQLGPGANPGSTGHKAEDVLDEMPVPRRAHTHTITHFGCVGILISQTACFRTVGGNQSSCRKPTRHRMSTETPYAQDKGGI